jgi:hypothetical protein
MYDPRHFVLRPKSLSALPHRRPFAGTTVLPPHLQIQARRLIVESSGERGFHHHYIDIGLVADIEGNKVRLSANGDVAVSFEEH